MLSEGGFEYVLNDRLRKLTKEEIRAVLKEGYAGLIAGVETLDKEVLKDSSLRVISRVGVGMDNIDLECAKDLGIKVYKSPYADSESVAELILA